MIPAEFNSLTLMFFVLLYVIAHFAFYILYGRNTAALRTERGIFLFHVVSFIFATTFFACTALHFNLNNIFAIWVGACAIHGIYSLSFLEMWALLEGGFVIRVLKYYPNTKHLAEFGDKKFAGRIESLQSLGLITVNNDTVDITKRGQTVAKSLNFIVNLCNQKVLG